MNEIPRPLLDLYPAIARPRSTPIPLGNAGGFSGARLWRYESAMGRLVVRAWPSDGPDAGEIETIGRWLSLLGRLPFVPVPIRTIDGRGVVSMEGRLWELAPWRPGSASLRRPIEPAKLRGSFTGLAQVHVLLGQISTTAPSPGLKTRVDEVTRLQDGELTAIERAVAQAAPSRSKELAQVWIEAARTGLDPIRPYLIRASIEPVRLQPVLRDARVDHFLFEGETLTGLVDFGAMGVDTPATDLARLLGESTGRDGPSRSIALEAYEAIRPIPLGERDLIDVFETANAWLGPAHWLRWGFLERRAFDDPEAVRKGLERTLERWRERV